MNQQIEIVCPVCGNNSETVMPLPDWGEMRKCMDCGLFFADPMTLPMTSEELYTKAYNGELEGSQFDQFNYRMNRRKGLLEAGESALTSVHHLALQWLQSNLPKASRVLEIGCGPGLFLYALRDRGYKPMAIEPGQLPASTLREEGFEIWNGTLDNYPLGGPSPDVVVCFNMLHHLPAPLDFFSLIAKRFPTTTLLVGHYHQDVYDLQRKPVKPKLLPPRTLTIWTKKALERALINAGYTPLVQDILPTGREVRVPGSTKVFFSNRALPVQFISLFLRARPFLLAPLALWQRHSGKRFYLFAVGLRQQAK